MGTLLEWSSHCDSDDKRHNAKPLQTSNIHGPECAFRGLKQTIQSLLVCGAATKLVLSLVDSLDPCRHLLYTFNSLDPTPSSPPDLRPSGRGPGKTAILFGELRATSSIFSRFGQSFTCRPQRTEPVAPKSHHRLQLLQAGVAPCSCLELLARSMWTTIVFCGVFVSFRFTETRPQLEGD